MIYIAIIIRVNIAFIYLVLSRYFINLTLKYIKVIDYCLSYL